MAIGRKKSLIIGATVTVILLFAVGVQLIPEVHMAVLSKNAAEKFTGDTYNISLVKSNDSGSNLTFGSNAISSAQYYSNSSGFGDSVYRFSNTTTASIIYGYFSISLPTILSNIGNSTFRGFSYSYVIQIHPSVYSNKTYIWGACGIEGHLVFSLSAFGPSKNMPSSANMTSLIEAQINAMESPSWNV